MSSRALNYANVYILELHHFYKPLSSQFFLYCIEFYAKHANLIGKF